jgi:nitroreductase
MIQNVFVFLILFAFFLSGNIVNAKDLENETLKTIFSRKSVRKYKNEPIEKDKIILLVKAGMAAPSAVDKRPWDFIVVTDKKILKELSDKLPYAKMTQNAAVAIIVCGNIEKQYQGKDSVFWIMDCSAATENILIAAESLGLGAVWTAVYPEKERINSVKKILNIPENVIPLNVIPIGIPLSTEMPKNKYDPSQLHFNKW